MSKSIINEYYSIDLKSYKIEGVESTNQFFSIN